MSRAKRYNAITGEWDYVETVAPGGGSGGLLPVIYVSTETGATVTATKGSVSVTAEYADNHYILKVPDFGTWLVSAEKDGKHNEVSVTVDVVKEYSVSILIGFIYGVEWDKSASTKLSRTDDAVLFTDPVPYLSGMAEGDYSSPFDGLSPWKDISIEEDPTVGSLVKIPKFWYKITSSASKLKFQIANFPAEGFSVSPGHMDRGDGKGERDYIYVARYHCSENDYKSVTGVKPKVSITRAAARTAIHNLKSDVWQLDYATWWTINLLYLVEFADWDCQKTIGYGRGNGSAVENMGYTDTMPYHTGSTKASKTTYGVSTQYRYMEGLWDNCLDWCDGVTFSGTNVFACLNPSNFADNTTNFTQVGTRPTDSNVIKDWSIPSAEGYEWCLYPSVIGGTNMEEYCADKCYYSAGGVVLYVGGYYNQNLCCGLFYRSGYNAASSSSADIGARLQRLP